MIYFKNRALARSFASKKESYKVVDNGGNVVGRRWGVRVI
jgi:hypothetical protein